MIVLTGGAGFIGANILEHLNRNGIDDVIVVDHLNHPAKNNNIVGKKYSKFYDKKEFLQVLPTLQNVIAIIHQGACSSTTETNEAYLQENNVAYSKTLLHYAVDKKIPFLYASSASVYGNGKLGFEDTSNDYFPINGYANSKLTFDKYVTNLLNENAINSKVIGLRYFNVYGYGEAHKQDMASVLYKFYQSYLKEKKIYLFKGSDTIKRDFVHVDDVVLVNYFCLTNAVPNGVYNVGSGMARSFQSLAESFINVFSDATLEFIPFPEKLKEKYQFFTEADISKLREIGYNAALQTLEEGTNIYLKKLKEIGS